MDGRDSRARILIVAGEAGVRAALIDPLRKQGHTVESVAGGNKALVRLGELAPDLVLLDVESAASGNGSGHHGAALVARLVEQDPDAGVVAMVAAGDVEAGVGALVAGASYYLTKPINGTELSLVVERELARRRLRAVAIELRARLTERYRFENIVGSSAPMQAVFKTVAQVAAGRASVLLTGEAGTGKALIAGAIHEKSPRAHAPFVRLSCRGHAESMLDSELFGHEHAPVATATHDREGRLVQAQGGTLFLEAIDALPEGLQVKLRRFLESGRFERAEGDQPIAADVRVIAASARDLPQLVADGQLREDLFRRLAAVHIEMPALRDRSSDVPALALHFLRIFIGARGQAIAGFDEEAFERLGGYAWPGNVRELEDVVERAVGACRGPRITAADLPPSLRVTTARTAVPIPGSTLEAIERYAILRTLEATDGSTTRAAEILGISVRKVQYKLQDYQSTLTIKSEPSKGSEPPAMGSGGGAAYARRATKSEPSKGSEPPAMGSGGGAAYARRATKSEPSKGSEPPAIGSGGGAAYARHATKSEPSKGSEPPAIGSGGGAAYARRATKSEPSKGSEPPAIGSGGESAYARRAPAALPAPAGSATGKRN